MIEVLAYFIGSLILLGLLLWLLATLYIYVVHRRYAHIPSPKTSSFYLGHLPAVSKTHKEGRMMGELFLEWEQECGPLFVVFFMHVPAVFTLNVDNVKELLMNVNLPKATSSYKNIKETFGQRFLGQGLITLLDYDSWRPRRSLYDPTFTRKYLKGLIPVFNECVDQFLDDLHMKVEEDAKVMMRKELGAITLYILGKVAFGSDFSQPRSDKDLGLKNIKGDGTLGFLIEHTFKGVQLYARTPLYSLFHPYLAEGYRESIRGMRQIGRDCIVQRYTAISNDEEVPNDILTQILRVASGEKAVDFEVLVDDFVSFYIAGQETTALMLTFALIMLCQHPEVKQRVLDEITDVLGDRDYVTAEDIEQLKYMEQVFLEVLRLYPPGVGTSRESPSDEFELSGYRIPKGTTIMLSFYANHHHPDHWEDPEAFDPSRFNPDRGKPSPFIFTPFSSGHRSCIGKVFAMMEGKIILARLLSTFKVNLQEGYQFKVQQTTTLRPADFVPCTLVALK